MAKLERVPAGQALEVLRQLGFDRHVGAIDEHRDYRNVALERRGDLDADVIPVALEPLSALLVLRLEPMRSDQRQQHVALRDLGIELLDKIEARLDGVDIDEEVAAREALGEMIVEPARYARCVVSPVVDEDAGHARTKRSTTGRGPRHRIGQRRARK